MGLRKSVEREHGFFGGIWLSLLTAVFMLVLFYGITYGLVLWWFGPTVWWKPLALLAVGIVGKTAYSAVLNDFYTKR